MFEPAKNFMFLAARKYNLEPQALGALMCEKARGLIKKEFSSFKSEWQPQKYEAGTLTIKTISAAGSSALYMQTHHFLEALNAEELPEEVKIIKINKSLKTAKNNRL